MISIHWCLFDRKCRYFGAPPRIYIRWRQHRTIYFNPFEWGDRGFYRRQG